MTRTVFTAMPGRVVRSVVEMAEGPLASPAPDSVWVQVALLLLWTFVSFALCFGLYCMVCFLSPDGGAL